MKKRTKSSVKEDKSRKRLNKTSSKFVKTMESIEKDYPGFDILSKDHLAYLMNRDLGHSNMHKVQREATTQVLKYFFEANLVMMNLDSKYKSRIVHNDYFYNYMRMITDMEAPNDEGKDNDEILAMWSTFVRVGLAGLRKNLPSEFTNVLDNMMNPVSDMLDGIIHYSTKLGSEKYKNLEKEWGYINISKKGLL